VLKDGNRRRIDGTCGAILAGGAATRFDGRDKGRLVVGGVRIIDRAVAALRGVAQEVFVVANDIDRYRDLGVPVVPDVVTGAGPLGGLHAALRAAPRTEVVVLACDMPFVTAALLEALVGARGDRDAVVPRTVDGWHPLCAVYSTRILPVVERHLREGRLALHALIDAVDAVAFGPDALKAFDHDGLLLANLNSAADYDEVVGR
jgi:molybdenum cofactor guanylyltransferase